MTAAPETGDRARHFAALGKLGTRPARVAYACEVLSAAGQPYQTADLMRFLREHGDNVSDGQRGKVSTARKEWCVANGVDPKDTGTMPALTPDRLAEMDAARSGSPAPASRSRGLYAVPTTPPTRTRTRVPEAPGTPPADVPEVAVPVPDAVPGDGVPAVPEAPAEATPAVPGPASVDDVPTAPEGTGTPELTSENEGVPAIPETTAADPVPVPSAPTAPAVPVPAEVFPAVPEAPADPAPAEVAVPADPAPGVPAEASTGTAPNPPGEGQSMSTTTPTAPAPTAPAPKGLLRRGARSAGEPRSVQLAREAAENAAQAKVVAEHPDMFDAPTPGEIERRRGAASRIRQLKVAQELAEAEHAAALADQRRADELEAARDRNEAARLSSPVGQIAEHRAFGRQVTRMTGVILAASVLFGALNVHSNWSVGLTIRDLMWWGWWLADPMFSVGLLVTMRMRSASARTGYTLGHATAGRGALTGARIMWAVEALLFAVTVFLNARGDWSGSTAEIAGEAFAHSAAPVALLLAMIVQAVGLRDAARRMHDARAQLATS